MPKSPTQLTLKKLRDDGYLAAVVEHWNPHAHIRQDLFGIVDVLGIRAGETIAVQATTKNHVVERVNKIADHDSTPIIREAGWQFEVHGWHQPKGKGTKYVCRVVDVS